MIFDFSKKKTKLAQVQNLKNGVCQIRFTELFGNSQKTFLYLSLFMENFQAFFSKTAVGFIHIVVYIMN